MRSRPPTLCCLHLSSGRGSSSGGLAGGGGRRFGSCTERNEVLPVGTLQVRSLEAGWAQLCSGRRGPAFWPFSTSHFTEQDLLNIHG